MLGFSEVHFDTEIRAKEVSIKHCIAECSSSLDAKCLAPYPCGEHDPSSAPEDGSSI